MIPDAPQYCHALTPLLGFLSYSIIPWMSMLILATECRSGTVCRRRFFVTNNPHAIGIWTCNCIINLLPYIFLFWPHHGSGMRRLVFSFVNYICYKMLRDSLVLQNVVLLIHFFTGLILMVISFIMGLMTSTMSTNSFLKVSPLIFFKCSSLTYLVLLGNSFFWSTKKQEKIFLVD